MLKFIDLRESSGRTVSISYSDKAGSTCQLLGVLPHCTNFDREDMIQFANDILEAFEGNGYWNLTED